ncbi:AAA family ATPase [Serratia fonticola]
MIKSIRVDNRELLLTSNNDENFFDIDSMSLLIGENGSGKTYFFKQIVNEFRSSHIGTFTGDCEVVFRDNPEPNPQDEMRYWGVIYYSPVPHRPKFSPYSRFKDASPIYGKKFDVINLLDYKDIIEAYGITPKIVLKSNVKVQDEIKWLIESMSNSDSNYIDKIFDSPSNLRKLLEINAEVKKMSLATRLLDGSEMVSKGESLSDILIDELIEKLNRALTNIGTTAFAITLSVKRKHGLLKKNAIPHILYQFINPNDDIDKASGFNNFNGDYQKVKSFMTAFQEHSELIENHGLPVDPYKTVALLEYYGVEKFLSLEFSDMSTGELSFLIHVSSIASALTSMASRKIKRFLILIDEGDAFLHLEWQRKYINQLNKLLKFSKEKLGIEFLQLILATHSPLLATDIPKKYICIMDQGKIKSGFAAPIHTLLNESFGSKTIGEFASNKINELVEAIFSGVLEERHHAILKSIDNEIIKRELNSILQENGFHL